MVIPESIFLVIMDWRSTATSNIFQVLIREWKGSNMNKENKRIISIDALMGFDMLIIIFADRLFMDINFGLSEIREKT